MSVPSFLPLLFRSVASVRFYSVGWGVSSFLAPALFFHYDLLLTCLLPFCHCSVVNSFIKTLLFLADFHMLLLFGFHFLLLHAYCGGLALTLHICLRLSPPPPPLPLRHLTCYLTSSLPPGSLPHTFLGAYGPFSRLLLFIYLPGAVSGFGV